MLIRLSPDLVENRAAELLAFLADPYSPRSCDYVTIRLPEIAEVYGATAQVFNGNAGHHHLSLVQRPGSAFHLNVKTTNRAMSEVLDQLLQSQVRLLEEDFRDVQDGRGGFRGDRRRADAGPGSKKSVAMCLRAQALHEAVFLRLVGHFEVRLDGRQLQFDLTELGERCLWSRVRSGFMQMHTDAAVRQRMANMVADLRHRSGDPSLSPVELIGQLRASDLDNLVLSLLDTYYALSSRMQRDPLVAPLLAGALHACRWVAVLELGRLAGAASIALDDAERRRLRLSSDVLNRIVADRQSEIPSDQGIERLSDGSMSLGTSNLGHVMHCCKRAVIDSDAARLLGPLFERHFIEYVQDEVPEQDYVVREGVKSKAKSNARGMDPYDSDLILFEPGRRKVFFVQTKWKRENRSATLRDELALWTANNAFMTTGVGQLNALRHRLGEPNVIQQVAERLKGLGLSAQDIIDGAEFVVVHTLPYFSAYEHEGVAIYEWNLFRNALLRGLTLRRSFGESAVGSSASSRLLHLEDPDDVLGHFEALSGVRREAMPQMRQARADLRYGFDLPMPPRPWWLSWLGPKRWRVWRPCL